MCATYIYALFRFHVFSSMILNVVYHLLNDEQLKKWDSFDEEYFREEITFQVRLAFKLICFEAYNSVTVWVKCMCA